MRLGGPIFVKSDDPAVLAKAHRDLGYRAAYAPEVALDDAKQIEAIIKAYATQDVVIAEVGAWVNMLDPNPEKRRKNMAYVTERLALAEALAARCCVDIAGSYNPDIWWGPDPRNLSQEFLDATVENARKLIDAVKPRRTTFSIEMSPWSIPSGPDEYLGLIKAVDRKAFSVHVDICNIVNSPYRMYHNGEVIGECFRKLGRYIVSCHAKDLQGVIDYNAWLRELSHLPVDVPLMLEHLQSAEEYTEGRRYIQRMAHSLGVRFNTENS
jgi:sugar phosphate isomerase/epimerase